MVSSKQEAMYKIFCVFPVVDDWRVFGEWKVDVTFGNFFKIPVQRNVNQMLVDEYTEDCLQKLSKLHISLVQPNSSYRIKPFFI